eukprot:g27057.t1
MEENKKRVQQLVSEIPYLGEKEVWRRCQQVLSPTDPLATHLWAYRQVWGAQAEGFMAPVWVPDPNHANDEEVMKLAKSLGHQDYQSLFDWAANPANRDAFWTSVKARLGIRENKGRLNIIDSCFQAPPHEVAVRLDQGKFWTYAQLRARVNQVSNALHKVGLTAGKKLGLVMPMTEEACAFYLGAIQAGCAIVSVAESFSAFEIAIRLRVGAVDGIFTQDVLQHKDKCLPIYAKVAEARTKFDFKGKVYVLRTQAGFPLKDGDIDLGDLLRTASPSFTPVQYPPDAITHVLFSSGTTGDPKAIPWTHTTGIKCAADATYHLGVRRGDVVTWATSLGWMMGPWVLYAALLNQASFAISIHPPSSPSYWQFCRENKVTMLGLFPRLCRAWKEMVEEKPSLEPSLLAGLASVRCFGSTGEASRPEESFWLSTRVPGYAPVIEYCGGTEIGGGFITGCLLQPQVPSAFSTPSLGLDVQLLDSKGHIIQGPGEGELVLVPPSLGLSERLLNHDHHKVYFRGMPKFRGVQLRRHGDQMRRLPNGYFRASGRTDDTMNLAGVKVSSVELERALHDVPGVGEIAAVGAIPPKGGAEELVLFVVAAAGNGKVNAETLRGLCENELRKNMNPLFRVQLVVLVDHLPRTATNKVMRRVLRQQAEQTLARQAQAKLCVRVAVGRDITQGSDLTGNHAMSQVLKFESWRTAGSDLVLQLYGDSDFQS